MASSTTPRRPTGIIAAIPTPFDENEELALDALASNIARWNETRLDGYTVLGTTGEFVSLTTDERKAVIERARNVIPESKTMLAGTGEESTRAAAELTRWASEIGCDYAIVVTPHYLRMAFSNDSLPDHYHRVADASRIPVVAYLIPVCTGLDVPPDTVASIAEHPNIVGIKDSSGDVRRAATNATALSPRTSRCSRAPHKLSTPRSRSVPMAPSLPKRAPPTTCVPTSSKRSPRASSTALASFKTGWRDSIEC